ncbi:hypothetical protein QE390_005092 [Siphonobacter sp. SORGH_AS 1065]|nr:hypothetical protein [Siphonobacter sp. SORGH_AS_1065]
MLRLHTSILFIEIIRIKIFGSGLIAFIGEEKLINKQADCRIMDRH